MYGGGICKKFKMRNFNPLNNVSSMNYALKSVYGYAYVEVPHGDKDGPRTPPRCMEEVWKKFQMNDFTMLDSISSMNYVLKSVPGLADVGVPHADEDGPRTPAPGSG